MFPVYHQHGICFERMKLRLINFPRNLVLSLSLSRSRYSTLIFANNAFFLLSPPRSVHGGHPPFSRSQGLRESVSIRLCRLEDWNNFNIQGSSDREKWRILTSVTEKQRWVERRRFKRRFSNLSLLRYITDLSKLNGDGVRGKLLKG